MRIKLCDWSAYREAVESFPARLVDVDSSYTTFTAGVCVVEPDRDVGIVNHHGQGGHRSEVACLTVPRIEPIDCGVDQMSWNAWRGEQCLCGRVVSLCDFRRNSL